MVSSNKILAGKIDSVYGISKKQPSGCFFFNMENYTGNFLICPLTLSTDPVFEINHHKLDRAGDQFVFFSDNPRKD